VCLIAWRTDHRSAWPLLLAANRDEFHAREALGVHQWSPAELDPASGLHGRRVVAGKDLRAGGTWLGLAVTDAGIIRIAALTNVRDGRLPPPGPDVPSRGRLVIDTLSDAGSTFEALARLARGGAARAAGGIGAMAGFNLVAIEIDVRRARRPIIETAYLTHVGPVSASAMTSAPRAVPEGIHALSNANLDQPWPKTRLLAAAIQRAGERLDSLGRAAAIDQPDAIGRPDASDRPDDAGLLEAAEADLFAQLADRRPARDDDLPDTGISPERERWLSSPFIVGEDYGTRCSTVIAVDAQGRYRVHERRFDAAGELIGSTAEMGPAAATPIS
jgi:uncharacterized protein with NRDE domain